MKKSIAIVLCTFAVLLAAYLVYYLSTDDMRVEHFRRPPRQVQDSGAAATMPFGKIGDVQALTWQQYDKQNHLVAIYKADVWRKEGERYVLTRPRVEWYLKSGEVAYIEADKGLARVDPVGNRMIVREGDLAGNVKIIVDRSRTDLHSRTPINTRPDDAVTIRLQDARFNSEDFIISSLGQVSVFSNEADIFGTGLMLAWSEGPRELRELRIDAGEYMIIRQGQDQFMADMKLPGSVRDSGAAAAKPAAKPAAKLQGAQTYQVDFFDKITATAGPRSLRGADRLMLTFDYKGSDASLGQPGKTTASAAPAGAPKPATESEPLILTWSGPLVMKPVRDLEPQPKRLIVQASGKQLYLSDGDAFATCQDMYFKSPQRRAVLTGSDLRPAEVRMANGSSLYAKVIDYDQDGGHVSLDGEGKLFMPSGAGGAVAFTDASPPASASAQDIDLTISWSKSLKASLKTLLPGSNQKFEPLSSAVITGDVLVQDGLSRSMRGDALTVNFHVPDQAGQVANRLKDMTAEGNVELADAASGDFIKARNLVVTMTGPEQGRSRPVVAVATGDVSARQSRSSPEGRIPTDVTGADEVTIYFADVTDPITGKLKQAQPQHLIAKGNLEIHDMSGQDAILAKASVLDALVQKGQATLRGAPASIAQKDNFIKGGVIMLEKDTQTATVVGPGSLCFWTDADLSGNRLLDVGPVTSAPTVANRQLVVKPIASNQPDKPQAPRPVEISWATSMKYCGNEGWANILDHVKLTTAGDSLACEQLDLYFTEGSASKPAGAANPPAVAKPNVAGEFQFRMNRLAKVVATKNVRMESASDDAEGFQIRRVLLLTEQFTYYFAARLMSCDKPGSLLAEDYRSPDSKVRAQETLSPTGNIDRPSQTAFRWTGSMKMDQVSRSVTMDGGVRMVHASGSQIELRERLRIRPWRDLPTGRKTALECDSLLAMFGPPEDKGSSAYPRDPQAGPQVGPLNMFKAFGVKGQPEDLVRLEDGPREVYCRRLDYQRIGEKEAARDTMVLLGSLPGEPARPAVVNVTDKGTVNTVQGPRLVWDRKNNRIEVPRIEGSGGR